jgi:hypothetical protein
VQPARTRTIDSSSKILLAIRSGGRCEFAGCNKYLFEHPLTLKGGNFCEHAHIVAFSERGPRAHDGERPEDINSVDNLMLLCAACHKEIDSRPGDYPRSVLEQYKREHEARIHYVTGLGPDQRTSVVQLKARIGGQAVDIPATHIYAAIAPRYPDKQGLIIDLTGFGTEDVDAYYTLAAREIRQKVDGLYQPGMSVESTRHISLFALAPIPVLMYVGRCLSNKVAVDFFQRHRGEDHPWNWLSTGEVVTYSVNKLQSGTATSRVALILSLSGVIHRSDLPRAIDQTFSIYEITLKGRSPSVDC